MLAVNFDAIRSKNALTFSWHARANSTGPGRFDVYIGLFAMLLAYYLEVVGCVIIENPIMPAS